jgi:hypothetical protein
MPQKILSALVVLGVMVAFAGLLFMPAALNSRNGSNDNLLGAGLAVFSFGALAVSMGMYGKARLLRAAIDADPNLQALLQGAKSKGSCEMCRSAAPVVHCSMHKLSLCSNCLNQHYDPRACVYVPSWRKTVSRSRAASARG